MRLEAAGFAPGIREDRDVYAQRIAVFPEGSLIAEADGRPAGCIFCEIRTARTQWAASDFQLGHDIAARHDPSGSVLYVASMTLDPSLRGQGLGGSFFNGAIDHIMRRFPLIDSSILLVNATWTAAREIYSRSGFDEVLTLQGFFTPRDAAPEDGIVMRKRLR
jgi:ribosomal-protein-alanine N-acetyltransferase